jgi:gliding motility-associated-like protein
MVLDRIGTTIGGFVLVLTSVPAFGQCTADAGPATVTVCGGQPLNLNGSGTGAPPLSYAWTGSPNITGGNSANAAFEQPPPVSGALVVNLTLTVTDANGCVATDQIAVTVNPTAHALLTANSASVVFDGATTFFRCVPITNPNFLFDYGGFSVPGSTHTINWGDGSPNYTTTGTTWPQQAHTFGQGITDLTYTITQPNGCNSTMSYSVFLGANPSGGILNPGNTEGCGPMSLNFPIEGWEMNTPGTIYTVTVNDGSAPVVFTHPPPAIYSHLFSVGSCGTTSTDGTNTFPHSYFVNVLIANPCNQSGGSVVPIKVSLPATSDFTIAANDTACVNSTVTFTSTSTGNEIQGNTCDDTPPLLWTIAPATGWTVASGTLGNDNGAVGAGYDPSAWSSGSTTLGVQFSTPGNYTIDLVSGNYCGGDTMSRSICVEGPPQPAFTLTPNTGCAPFTSLVDNTSTSPNSCLTTYAWNVSTSSGACGSGPAWNYTGGTSATAFEPQFQFTQAGTYTIQLQATNSCGTFNQSAVVTANAPPQVEVTDLAGICATQCVDPSAVVQDCGAAINSYAWTFNGGSPATANTLDPPSVCYAAATSSSIALTVTNACGSASDVTTLAVGAVPAIPVIASNSPVCAGQVLSVSANAIPGLTYQWTGPNGFTSDQPAFTIPNVTAASAGTYTVAAVTNGCPGPSATVNVTVNPAPTLTVTPGSAAICNGAMASFTVSGAGNYQWYIGNTLVGTGPLFTTSPAISTTYTVTGSTGGCPGSATVPVTVFPVTNVNAGADRTECDQAIGVNLGGFPAPGTWSGTNVTSGGVFTPVPDQLGPVTLTYTHVDGNGCTNSDQVVVTVQDLTLIADAGNDTSFCQGSTPVNLPASPSGGTWSGAVANGQFAPINAGAYSATYAYGIGTCATSDQVNITVLAAPVLNLQAPPMLCVNSAAVGLSATPVGGAWSGTGVVGPPDGFDPAIAGAGTHTLAYAYTDQAGCASVSTMQAVVNPLPVVNAGDDLQLCDQPVPYTLTGTPVGGTWSANTMNVTPQGEITPAGVGTDVLTYSYTDGAGCAGTDQLTVTVVPIDVPAFAGNDTSVCVNSGDLQLTGVPAGGTWSGTDVTPAGTFSTNSPGNHLLTYAHGAGTCLIQDQLTVVVHALPVVDAGQPLAICLDAGPQLLTATPPGGTWTGTGVDPGGIFDPLLAQPGDHSLSYSYTDPATTCSNNTSTLVTVNALPQAAFVHDPVACVGIPFAFVNNTSGAATYEWDFGDGAVSYTAAPQHIYGAPGPYAVRLIAITAEGCRDTAFSSLEVWEGPQASFSLSTELGCGPLEVGFTNTSVGEGLSFAWEFGGLGGSAEESPGPMTFPAVVTDPIVYPISLTVANTCGQVVANGAVTVMPMPTALFGPSLDQYCPSSPVPFGNASYGAPTSFEWLFGDGTGSTDPGPTVTHTYVSGDDPIPITVTLIATNTCGSDTAYQDITILPNQVNAFFNADPVQGCSPLTVELTQYSVGDTTFYWDLGDGNTSGLHDLSWTYTVPGTYTIALFAFGCGSDSATMEVTVLPGPSLDFTVLPETACADVPFQFDATTSAVSSLSWDFGDGTGSTLTDPLHVFDGGGTYQVTLTGTAVGSGCTSTVTHPVMVLATPQASFVADPNTGCMPLEVSFDNTSTGSDFAQWDFGDGNTTAITDPFHTYTAPGTFVVRLVAEAQNGCSDTTFASITVYPLPIAAFELSQYSSCEPTTTVQTLNASQGAVGYSWILGNGNTSSLNQPEVTYTAPGTYPVLLTVTDQHGCIDTAMHTFIQYPTPLASFTTEPEPGCAGYPITFLNTSTNGVSYHWDLGDGHTSVTDLPLHTYDAPGVYDVRLITNGEGGCSDTLLANEAVHILERPLAAFGYDTIQHVAHALRFRNESVGAVSYTWDFGDGETSEARHPIHIFPADGGGFVVCLVAVNDLGCPDTLCADLYVPGDPNVFVPNAFTPNDDTRNDTFRPVLNGFVGWNYRFLIFDRWGQPAFDTRDRNTAWDGTRNGVDSPVDVYVWKVIVERDGDARDFTGHVTLVR